MCQALGIQWLNETNKVPNPQGAPILMQGIKILKQINEYVPGSEPIFCKNKAGYRGEGQLGRVTAIVDGVVKEGFSEEFMPSLRPK